MLEMEFGGDPRAAEIAKERGCIATWGKGATGPRGWKNASCVHEQLSGVLMVWLVPTDTSHTLCILTMLDSRTRNESRNLQTT